MPDISKINALAIGSVAKVDGLAKASILDIDGVTVPAGVAPPLDTYTGASAAYSVRLLRTLYSGPAMRVRRETAGGAGDDDEADIAFDSGVISLDSAISNASAGVTATTLGEFLNVGTVGGTTYSNPDSLTVTASCWVDEWKDQSGNTNHAVQATFGQQPQIHSGTVNTDLNLSYGIPTLQFIEASDSHFDIPFNVTDPFTLMYTLQIYGTKFHHGSDGKPAGYNLGGSPILAADTTYQGTAGVNNYIRTDRFSSSLSTVRIRINNSEDSFTAGGTYTAGSSFAIGAYAQNNGTNTYDGPISEFFIYLTFLSDTDTAGLEANVNDYYSIF